MGFGVILNKMVVGVIMKKKDGIWCYYEKRGEERRRRR